MAELTERLDAKGNIVTPLVESEVIETLRSLVDKGVKSVAVLARISKDGVVVWTVKS